MYWFQEEKINDLVKTFSIHECEMKHVKKEFAFKQLLEPSAIPLYQNMNEQERHDVKRMCVDLIVEKKYALLHQWYDTAYPITKKAYHIFAEKVNAANIELTIDILEGDNLFRVKPEVAGEHEPEFVGHELFVKINPSDEEACPFDLEQRTIHTYTPLLGLRVYLYLSQAQYKKNKATWDAINDVSTFHALEGSSGNRHMVTLYLNQIDKWKQVKALLSYSEFAPFYHLTQAYWQTYREMENEWKTYWRLKQ